MNGSLYILAESEVRASKPRIDLNRMTVHEENVSDLEFLTSLGVKAIPLTDDLRRLVLAERNGKSGERMVTLGDFGPILVVRIEDGVVVNKFTGHDLNRPMKLTRETVKQLVGIFGATTKEEN